MLTIIVKTKSPYYLQGLFIYNERVNALFKNYVNYIARSSLL